MSQEHLVSLRKMLAEARARLAEADQNLFDADIVYKDARENYDRLFKFYGEEIRRLGLAETKEDWEPIFPTDEPNWAVGLSLGDAIVMLLDQRRPGSGMTVDELQARLEIGGKRFGKYPARQIHAAVMKNSVVSKEKVRGIVQYLLDEPMGMEWYLEAMAYSEQ